MTQTLYWLRKSRKYRCEKRPARTLRSTSREVRIHERASNNVLSCVDGTGIQCWPWWFLGLVQSFSDGTGSKETGGIGYPGQGYIPRAQGALWRTSDI